ncbi:MAG: hypothetical protein CM1200mP2_15160 [Planctomycetaceae bacterium]|nr:MAG: hypothetical protein CM1200mP2_15160 [Planctomycetaceae bacterium]
MGVIYAREVLGIESPRVGLMNIGSEDPKGNTLYREAHVLLQESSWPKLRWQCRGARVVPG